MVLSMIKWYQCPEETKTVVMFTKRCLWNAIMADETCGFLVIGLCKVAYEEELHCCLTANHRTP
jgi:hypothetical protein